MRLNVCTIFASPRRRRFVQNSAPSFSARISPSVSPIAPPWRSRRGLPACRGLSSQDIPRSPHSCAQGRRTPFLPYPLPQVRRAHSFPEFFPAGYKSIEFIDYVFDLSGKREPIQRRCKHNRVRFQHSPRDTIEIIVEKACPASPGSIRRNARQPFTSREAVSIFSTVCPAPRAPRNKRVRHTVAVAALTRASRQYYDSFSHTCCSFCNGSVLFT